MRIEDGDLGPSVSTGAALVRPVGDEKDDHLVAMSTHEAGLVESDLVAVASTANSTCPVLPIVEDADAAFGGQPRAIQPDSASARMVEPCVPVGQRGVKCDSGHLEHPTVLIEARVGEWAPNKVADSSEDAFWGVARPNPRRALVRPGVDVGPAGLEALELFGGSVAVEEGEAVQVDGSASH